MNQAEYTWIDFYTEYATILLSYKDDRKELIQKIKNAFIKIDIKLPTLERDNTSIVDIDPFTIFGLFNKSITDQNRIIILTGIKSEFRVKTDVPNNFNGIPILNPLKATFYFFEGDRGESDIDNLWNLFEAAITYADTETSEAKHDFITAYNSVIMQQGVRWNITMGLYWIRPYFFLSLDSKNRTYLKNSNSTSDDIASLVMSKLPNAEEYLAFCDKCKNAIKTGKYEFKNFPELSYKAWLNDHAELDMDAQGGSDDTDEWWPSLSEYDPGLTADQYYKLFTDEKVVKRSWLEALYELYRMPGHLGTCKQLGDKYGHKAAHYISFLSTIACRIEKEKKCPVLSDDNNSKYWPILFQGRHTKNKAEGNYCWKIREPVKTAIERLIGEGVLGKIKETGEGILTEYKEKMAMALFDHNTILYGPPGTGKTRSSIIYAVAICEEKSIDDVQNEPYEDILERYKKLKESGRIAFTTFHQSYGYEEFIEGIKPELNTENKSIGYTIIPGVFKEFCNRAKTFKVQFVGNPQMKEQPKIWGMILGGTGMTDLKRHCFDNNEIRLGWNEIIDDSLENDFGEDTKASWQGKRMVSDFKESMEIGDIVVIEKNNKRIDAIGVITGDYQYDKSFKRYPRSRKVEWLVKNIDQDIIQFLPNGRKQLSRYSVFAFDYIGMDVISQILKKNSDTHLVNVEQETKPYVFIIDEINRGNISKIFGELITLIEESKREGADEAMEAILPYSGDPFSVPNNVFILGTMNTADRSIALMDTALRRRFSFIEMTPNPEVLESLGVGIIEIDGEELNVANMLNVINERIEYLFDRDHMIGHAFFTKLAEDSSIKTLADIFEKNIIPLLQEYFYEDYEKIQLVLGDNEKEDEFKFILEKPLKIKNVFNGNPDIDLPEKRYSIQHEAFYKLGSYKRIAKDE